MEYPPSLEDREYAGQPKILYVLHFPVDVLTRCFEKVQAGGSVCIKHQAAKITASPPWLQRIVKWATKT
jgi:hypothetical protein